MATVKEVDRKVSVDAESMSVTRTLDVYPYADYLKVVNLLLGGYSNVGPLLYYRAPARDPYHPFCFCQSIDIDGVGAIGTTQPDGITILNAKNGYSICARLTAVYKPLGKATADEVENADDDGNDSDEKPQEKPEIDRAEQSWTFAAQQLTLPTEYYRFKNGGGPHPSLVKGINATKKIPRIEYSLMRHFVVNIPVDAITALIGRINRDPFRVGKAVWPAECLRFDGADVKQKITNRGMKLYDVSYKFSVMPIIDTYADGETQEIVTSAYSPDKVTVPASTTSGRVGWNRVYRPERGYWDKLVLQSDADRQIYNYAEDYTQTNSRGREVGGFNLLFHPRST